MRAADVFEAKSSNPIKVNLWALFFQFCAATFSFPRRNALLVAVTGAFGGFFAWIVSIAEELSKIFQLIGGFFGCLLAFVSFLFVLPKLIRFGKNWYQRGLIDADRE